MVKQIIKIDTIIPFEVWFPNKRTLQPVAWETQYIDIIQKKFAVMSHQDSHSVLTNKINSIDHNKYIEQALEQIDIWKPTILFIEKNYIEKVENITGLQFNQEKKFENASRHQFISPLKFTDLKNEMQEKVLEELDYEIGFYNKCIDLH